MVTRTAAAMPPRDAARFQKAVQTFRGPDTPLPLAAVVQGAHRSGWSYRTIARALEQSRERVMQLASLEVEPYDQVPQYSPGTEFPEGAVREFQRRSVKAAAKRDQAKVQAAATVKAAHDAGWSYSFLGNLAGISDETVRLIAAAAPTAVQVPPFSPPGRTRSTQPSRPGPGTLTPEEACRLAKLAAAARDSSKNTGRSLGPDATEQERAAAERSIAARRASEELSDMIIAARKRNVPWADLDAACGYRTGAARARAVRHGYGTLPPTRRAYQRHATPQS